MLKDKREKFDYSGFDMESINKNSIINLVIDNITFNGVTGVFSNLETDQVLKYWKGKFRNMNTFKREVISKLDELPLDTEVYTDIWCEGFELAEEFTYREAFELENESFRGQVFQTIDIVDMINNLGKTKIKVDGIKVKRKIFDINGEFQGYKEYDNVYETYEVDGTNLGIVETDFFKPEGMFAVRCWCTSTNEEHWIWIEEKYKNDPLEAIASTFRIHENLIPHISELKRQGDVMLVELKEDVEPSGEVVPLTKAQYFDLLTMET